MTVKAAFDLACDEHTFEVGINGHYFAQVGWKSPYSGVLKGPYLVHVTEKTCIEIDRHGVFKDSYSAKTDCFFPWVQAK
jgi:hypothetical protein